MRFKIGDLIIREADGARAMVVNTDRQERNIIKVQYYGVPSSHGYTGWHCDIVVTNWRHQ